MAPERLAQRLRSGEPPPRQTLPALRTAARGAIAGRHAPIKRRVRRPAQPRTRVRTVIIGATAAGETAERPAPTLRAGARRPLCGHRRTGVLRTSRPGLLTGSR